MKQGQLQIRKDVREERSSTLFILCQSFPSLSTFAGRPQRRSNQNGSPDSNPHSTSYYTSAEFPPAIGWMSGSMGIARTGKFRRVKFLFLSSQISGRHHKAVCAERKSLNRPQHLLEHKLLANVSAARNHETLCFTE